MKVGIVTFIRAYNHGAVLQAYALQKVLNDMGVEAEVIDYYPEYFYRLYRLGNLDGIRCFPYRPIKAWLKYLPMCYALDQRSIKFDRFIKKYIHLSQKQYKYPNELQNEELKYDAYICGSDQVWNYGITRSDDIFFLDFKAAEKRKKFSYAASFGMDEIPPQMTEEYRRLLSNYDKVSCREESGVRIIKDLLQQEATLVCDPTLLLESQDWSRLIGNKPKKKPYVLVYYVKEICSEAVFAIAQEIAKEKGFDIISITSDTSYDDILGLFSSSHSGKHIKTADPIQFIAAFFGAEYVVTDSFHGTVFSVLFHKKFVSVTKHYNKNGEIVYNERIESLLATLGLLDRKNNKINICSDIDWLFVDQRLDEERRKSLEYLQSIISEDY